MIGAFFLVLFFSSCFCLNQFESTIIDFDISKSKGWNLNLRKYRNCKRNIDLIPEHAICLSWNEKDGFQLHFNKKERFYSSKVNQNNIYFEDDSMWNSVHSLLGAETSPQKCGYNKALNIEQCAMYFPSEQIFSIELKKNKDSDNNNEYAAHVIDDNTENWIYYYDDYQFNLNDDQMWQINKKRRKCTAFKDNFEIDHNLCVLNQNKIKFDSKVYEFDNDLDWDEVNFGNELIQKCSNDKDNNLNLCAIKHENDEKDFFVNLKLGKTRFNADILDNVNNDHHWVISSASVGSKFDNIWYDNTQWDTMDNDILTKNGKNVVRKCQNNVYGVISTLCACRYQDGNKQHLCYYSAVTNDNSDAIDSFDAPYRNHKNKHFFPHAEVDAINNLNKNMNDKNRAAAKEDEDNEYDDEDDDGDDDGGRGGAGGGGGGGAALSQISEQLTAIITAGNDISPKIQGAINHLRTLPLTWPNQSLQNLLNALHFNLNSLLQIAGSIQGLILQFSGGKGGGGQQGNGGNQGPPPERAQSEYDNYLNQYSAGAEFDDYDDDNNNDDEYDGMVLSNEKLKFRDSDNLLKLNIPITFFVIAIVGMILFGCFVGTGIIMIATFYCKYYKQKNNDIALSEEDHIISGQSVDDNAIVVQSDAVNE